MLTVNLANISLAENFLLMGMNISIGIRKVAVVVVILVGLDLPMGSLGDFSISDCTCCYMSGLEVFVLYSQNLLIP